MALRGRLQGKREATRVLIADDDEVTRRLLQKTLEGAGFEVTVVENGRLALECLSQKDGPRLVLLDWLMPEINGLGVCREIRRHSEYPYIYIILLSTSTPDDTTIVTAMISMAQSLNLRVVAEGVESRDELVFLQARRCDEAQGYYFSRPVVAQQFAKLLKTGIPEAAMLVHR